jgi:hypothetical protein
MFPSVRPKRIDVGGYPYGFAAVHSAVYAFHYDDTGSTGSEFRDNMLHTLQSICIGNIVGKIFMKIVMS